MTPSFVPSRVALALAALLAGCGGRVATGDTFPPPGDWGTLSGPGGPAATFDDGALWQHCAYLVGGAEDPNHHNSVAMWDGWLVAPWALESGNGGLAFFAFDDPCNPVLVGSGFGELMRESHNIGFSRIGGGEWAVVNHFLGVQFWDISDPTAPRPVADLAPLPGTYYPDAYSRVVETVFWQGPYVYAGGADSGIYVIDATDPTAPFLVAQVRFDPLFRVGAVYVVGNLALVTTMSGPRAILMDLSEPLLPRPIAGGDFSVRDSAGALVDYYSANLAGRYALFARSDGGGGPVVYDVSDPSNPTRVGAYDTDGDGGYLYRHEDRLFVGDSNFASVYDFTNPALMSEIARVTNPGDMDTPTPVGNVVILSCDDDADPGQASAIIPYETTPDRRGPRIEFAWPPDGATFAAPTTRVGVVFDEMVEPKSVFEGSFRVATADGAAVPGWFNAQETIVNFTPHAPLRASTTYVVTVPTGGIVDWSGNATEEPFTLRFSTGARVIAE